MAGEKFTKKYGVASAQVYRGDVELLKIPSPTHFLYDPTAPKTFDELRVRAIDRDGHMSDPIEIWTDPDTRTMWVLDGRGRRLDVAEVNRRRAEKELEPVLPLIVPFPGDEKAAVARLREKNYHRRQPTPSGMALDILALRKAGHSWEACVEALHVESADAEQWCKKLLPLAHCVDEVRAAFDRGDLARGLAHRFGGRAIDGSQKLGKREQLDLLAELTEGRDKKASAPRPVSPAARVRVVAALTNGGAAGMKRADADVARVVAAAFARVGGDARALDEWPAVAAVVEEHLKKTPKAVRASTKESE